MDKDSEELEVVEATVFASAVDVATELEVDSTAFDVVVATASEDDVDATVEADSVVFAAVVVGLSEVVAFVLVVFSSALDVVLLSSPEFSLPDPSSDPPPSPSPLPPPPSPCW